MRTARTLIRLGGFTRCTGHFVGFVMLRFILLHAKADRTLRQKSINQRLTLKCIILAYITTHRCVKLLTNSVPETASGKVAKCHRNFSVGSPNFT